MTIALIETFKVTHLHSEVNAALAMAARAAFPGEAVRFFGPAEHVRAVAARLTAARREGHALARGIDVLRLTAAWGPGRAVQHDAPYLAQGLARAISGGARRVLLTYTTRLANASLAACARAFPWVRAAGIVHSFRDVEPCLRDRSPLGAVRRALWFDRGPRAPRLLLLGAGIARRIASLEPRIAHRLSALEHPAILAPERPAGEPRAPGPLRIGAIGSAYLDKGFARFVRVAERVVAAGLAPRPVLSWTGTFTQAASLALARTVPSHVAALEATALGLPREEYERRVRALDYVLLLHEPELFAARASGTFVDALSFGVPVIALRNPYFEEHLARMPGAGFLCDDDDAVVARIADLAANDTPEARAGRRAAVYAGRGIFSPESAAGALREALS